MTEIDPHLQNAVFGTPEVNPDEQHHYLGTFRERVYMTQRIDSLDNDRFQAIWKQILTDHTDGVLLLNGVLDTDDLNPFMQLAQQQQVEFRLVSDPQLMKTDLGIVYTADHAVHVEQIEIEQVSEKETPIETTPIEATPKAKKQSWFSKLF